MPEDTPAPEKEIPHYFVPPNPEDNQLGTDIVDSESGQDWHHFSAKVENRDKIINAKVVPMTRKDYDAKKGKK